MKKIIILLFAMVIVSGLSGCIKLPDSNRPSSVNYVSQTNDNNPIDLNNNETPNSGDMLVSENPDGDDVYNSNMTKEDFRLVAEYPSFNDYVDFAASPFIDSKTNPKNSTVVPSKNANNNVNATESASNSQGSVQNSTTTATLRNDMTAVWFSYIDWKNCLQGKNEADFKKAFSNVLSGLKKIGANTIVIHASSFGDAFYPSDISPWSTYVTGTLAKNPGYDPFGIIVKMAAEQNIAVHAWINPMRTFTDDEYKNIPDNYLIKKWYKNAAARYRYMIKDSNGKWILNPGNPEVVNHISALAAEIALKYNVEAIHIDDYFYPSGLTDGDKAYYDEVNPGKTIKEWRRDNTAVMIKKMYNAVKAARPNTFFGISPAGNMDYNYNTMYIDIKNMLSTGGYMDYITPQVYYGFANQSQPFISNTTSWNNMVKGTGVKLYIGLPCHKIGMSEDKHAGTGKDEWEAAYNSGNDIIMKMILQTRNLSECGGVFFFDYKSLLTPSGEFQTAALDEINNFKNLLIK